MKFFLIIAFCLLINLNLEAQGWLNRSTSFSDTFIDIKYYKGRGIIIGHQGIYLNTVSIDSTTKWNKLIFSGSAQNTSIFNATKFNQIQLDQHRGIAYISGYETTTNKGVIFKYNLDSLNYSLYYAGSPGKKITGIIVKDHTASFLGYLYAVGDSGMVINFDLTAGTNSIDYHGNHNFKGILDKFSGSAWEKIILYTEDKLFNGLNFPLQITGNYTLGSNIQHYIYSSTFSAGGFMIHNNKLSKSLFFTAPMSLFQTNMNRSNDSTLILHKVSYNPTSIFVATNKGIYKAFSDVAYECQSTSGVNDFRNLWFNVDTGYAVGTGGKVCYTRNAGGLVVPYREHKTQTKCVTESFQLDGRTTSTSYNCSFIIDGATTVSTSCKTFSSSFLNPTYTFTTIGNHTVNYKVTNTNGEFLDATKIFYIPAVPTINMPYSVNDSILCKAERVQYSITSTIANFEYHIIEQATGKSFGFGLGNGGTINFWTDTLRNQGFYFIRVQYPNTNCSRDFTNRTFIKVEKTQAIFKASKINMRTNEELILFDKSKDANSYNWSFFGGASISNSTLREPNLTYTSSGKKSARLIVTSPNNCKDTLEKDIVYVYNKTGSDDACYTIPYPNRDPTYHYGRPIKEKILFFRDERSYLINHYGDTVSYKSRYGDTLQSKVMRQSVLNMYSPDGALNWQINTSPGISIYDFDIDKSTNDIYFTGNCTDYAYINNHYICGDIAPYVVLNNGDTIFIRDAYPSSFNRSNMATSYIMKLDSNGRYKWHMILNGLNQNFNAIMSVDIDKIKVDNGSFYVSGNRNNQLAIYRNKKIDTIVNNSTINVPVFIKLDTSGKYKWHTESDVRFHDIAIDKKRNIHLISNYSNNGVFYVRDVKKDSFIFIKSTTGATNISSGYFSMDSNGNYRNSFYSRSLGWAESNSYNNIVIDNQDNIYISALTGYDSSAIVYPDGTSDYFQFKNSVLLKFKNKGKLAWSVGSESSYYGDMNSVFVKNNKVYVLGNVGINDLDSNSNFKFISKGGTNVQIKLNRHNFFIAEYDTSGFLYYVKKATNQISSNGNSVFTLYQISVDANENKLICGWRWLYQSSPITQNIFNVPLTTFSNVVFHAKFNEKLCNISAPPIANAGGDKNICIGDSIQIGNTGASHLRYFWRSEPAQLNKYIANPFVSPSKTSKYILTVVDSNGLYAYDTMMIFVRGDSISTGNDTTICILDSVHIGFSPLSGATYQWTSKPIGFNSTTSQPFVKPDTNTYYYLSANYQGCVIKDTIEVIVKQRVNAAVTISKNKSIICAKDTILFSPLLDSCGAHSKYYWKRNNITIGTDSILRLNNLFSGDSIYLEIIPGEQCVISTPIYSNKMIVNVIDTVKPTCNIISNKSAYCIGDLAFFSSVVSFGGSNPVFEWRKNNVIVSSNLNYSSNLLQNNDTITMHFASSLSCAHPQNVLSNKIVVKVSSIITPSITILGNEILTTSPQLKSITSASVAGLNPSFQWQDSTSTRTWTNISGAINSNISYNAFAGNKLRCRVISKDSCASPITFTSNVITFKTKSSIKEDIVKDVFVYPNPTKNKLTLSGLSSDDNWELASITDITGRTVIKNISIKNQSEVTIDIGQIETGSYILTITSKDNLVKSFNFIKE